MEGRVLWMYRLLYREQKEKTYRRYQQWLQRACIRSVICLRSYICNMINQLPIWIASFQSTSFHHLSMEEIDWNTEVSLYVFLANRTVVEKRLNLSTPDSVSALGNITPILICALLSEGSGKLQRCDKYLRWERKQRLNKTLYWMESNANSGK